MTDEQQDHILTQLPSVAIPGSSIKTQPGTNPEELHDD